MSVYTSNELMSVVASRYLVDGDHAFIGLGTGGRAFRFAIGIPSVAIALAQMYRGLDVIAQYGVAYEPSIPEVPSAFSDADLLAWRMSAQLPVDFALDMFKMGKITVGFTSAAQIDQFGNLNTVCIGPHDAPRVRLTGCIAQTDHAAHAKRTMVIVPHERRVFVPHIDYISAVGHRAHGVHRSALGLPGGGPKVVITDLAVLEFSADGRMTLVSVHPGVTTDQVVRQTSFPLLGVADCTVTDAPSREELDLIRSTIDRRAIFLGGDEKC